MSVYTYLLAIWHNEQQGVNQIEISQKSFIYKEPNKGKFM